MIHQVCDTNPSSFGVKTNRPSGLGRGRFGVGVSGSEIWVSGVRIRVSGCGLRVAGLGAGVDLLQKILLPAVVVGNLLNIASMIQLYGNFNTKKSH